MKNRKEEDKEKIETDFYGMPIRKHGSSFWWFILLCSASAIGMIVFFYVISHSNISK